MYGYFFRYGRVERESVELLKYKIKLPEFEGKDEINAFYGEVAEAVLQFCKNELTEYAEKEYDTSDISNKKFRYPPLIYTLSGEVTYEDGKTAFVRMEAILRHRGEEKIYGGLDAHAWALDEEMLLPPQLALREAFDEKIPSSVRRSDGVYLLNGKIYACRKNKIVEIAVK